MTPVEAITWKVVNVEGREVGSMSLDAGVFGAEVKPHLVHDTVRWQLARRRSGTHQALTRSMMRGGGKKPFKQKGSGRARAGSIISPLWVGGASIHGPLPRDYDYRLPKRTRKLALISALTDKAQGGKLIVVDEIKASGRTRDMAAALKKLGLKRSERVTLVVTGADEKLAQGARNIENVQILPVAGVNVYDLLRNEYLLGTKAAIEALQERAKR